MPRHSLVIQSKYTLLEIFILNSAIWLINTKPQNRQMHGRISHRRTCSQCGYTMKISSMYHRLLNANVKRTTELDGMGPLKILHEMNVIELMSILSILERIPRMSNHYSHLLTKIEFTFIKLNV